MADEVVIRFKADGGNLDQTLRQLREELGKLGNSNAPKSLRDTSAATTQLAQALGSSYKSAQQFSQQLGLTAQKSAEAVTKLRDLDRVGATNVEKFRALSREMGITRQQFEQLNQAAGKSKEGLQGLAVASGAIAAGLGAIGLQGIKTFAAFDGAIRTFGVVTSSTGTPALAALRGEVERLSAATTKTPQEIANVSVELGKAGFSAEQTKLALAGVVQSSEATGEGLARTGEVIGATLNQFGLSADKSLKIADLLTQASNASAAGTNDLGEALSYVGAQAKASNQSVEDTVTTLALLANGGIKGSSAGTGLAEALRRVKIASASATTELVDLRSRGSKNAIAAFERLNADVRDSTGQLLPFPEIIKKLKNNLGSLDEGNKDLLLNALFGVQGGRVIQTLLQQTDAQISQVTGSMANFEGSSKRASEELTKGLGGSLKLFGSSLALGTQKVGEFLAIGVEPLVRGASTLLNGFIALPSGIQSTLIAIGGFTFVLSAAVAAVAAFQAANGAAVINQTRLAAVTALDTILTNANAAAKLLAAAATGKLTAAQNASIGAFVRQAATAGLAAGAIAAIGLAVDTFQAVGRAATEQTQGVAAFEQALVKLNEAQLKTTDAETQRTAGSGLATAANKRIQDSIGGIQQGLDVLRSTIDKFSLKTLLDEFAKLDLVPGPIKALVIQLSNALGKTATAAEAAANNSTIAFGEVLSTADKVDKAFNDLFAGGRTGTKEEIEALNGAIAASISAIEKAQPANEAEARAKELRLKQLKQQQEQVAKLGKTEAANADAAKANNKVLDDPKKAQATEKTDLKADRTEEKAQKEQAFQDAQQQKEQAFQDEKQAREQAFNDAKQAKEQAFQDQQTAREQAFQDAKQTREQAFGDQQRSREQAFQDQQKAAQDAFQEGQRVKTEAFNKKQQADQEAFSKKQSEEKAAFDKQLSGEEKAINRRQQLRDADTPDAKANLRKSFREQDRNAKELEPLEAKRKAFEEKQKAEAKAEEERKRAEQEAEDEVRKREQQLFEAQQKEETRLFQEGQRKLEADFKLQERELDRAFKTEQQTAEKAFKAEQQAADRAFKQQEQASDRAFKAEQQAADRAFKQQQREFDLETARQVKAIAESTKPPTAEPTTNNQQPTTKPPGRRLGGPVDAGSLYQVGEAGAEYFVPSQRGYVINHSESIALAREALGSGRSAAPAIALMSTPSNDAAMLKELRSLRKIVEQREGKIEVPVVFEGAKSEGNSDRFWRLQRAMYRGMLG